MSDKLTIQHMLGAIATTFRTAGLYTLVFAVWAVTSLLLAYMALEHISILN